MFIQEIIIDGFKSYAQKTVVSGFDPQFNAITGLNGTGKSNILDSICFVLGISNLTQVRVGNLQELVYKQGQAGVTKASVTIIFNNSDSAASPVGYESHKTITVTRQIVIGGKNKYMINGHTVQQNQVQNMFHSVQLNVNNPHFLIMQGRITKVLNMKPPEILSMIEEAAGTRMFETKKQAALKTIQKKQLKVDEITKCIEEEITPTLENLRTERQIYHEWQANNAEFERLERFCVAHEFQTAHNQVTSADGDKQAIVDALEEQENIQKECNAEVETCNREIAHIETLRSGEMGTELQNLKHTETEISKEVVKMDTFLKNQADQLKSEEDSLKSLTDQFSELSVQVQAKKIALEECKNELIEKEHESQAAEAQHNAARERYQNACAGVTDESNSELLSLPEQVAVWEKRTREAHSTVQQCQQRSAHARSQLKELQKASKKQSTTHSSVLQEIEALQKEINDIEAATAPLKQRVASIGDENTMRSDLSSLQQSQSQLHDQIDSLTAALEARLAFDFKDPEKGFDRSRVKGLVAKLIKVESREAATALEIAAGSKLYQVVVDTELTGKLLLQKGGLRKRVTILPLNKISSRCVEPAKVKNAERVASKMGGTAKIALELVGYEEELRKAMEYVFGSAIICNSPEIAKAIAFDPSIRNRTVTLDGDVYDPSGTLTGGAKNQIGVLLSKIDELHTAQQQLHTTASSIEQLQRSLGAMEKDLIQLKKYDANLEIKNHAIKIAQEKMADSTFSQIMNEINEIEEQLRAIEQEEAAAKDLQQRAKEELKKLQTADRDNKKRREQVMKEMEKSMKDAQKVASQIRVEVATLKSKRDTLAAELKAADQEFTTIKDQQTICEATITRLTNEIVAQEAQLNSKREEYEEAKRATAEKNEELNQCSKEIKALQKRSEKMQKDSQHANLEARKLQHKLKQWEKEAKDAVKYVASLIKQHPWIEREKEFFGQAGSDFDFNARDVVQCQSRRKELKAEQDKLAKKINRKVMGMIENAESEYEELNRKREVILNDKSKIEAVIEELDVKKTQALQNTWVKVNRDFGSIFSMLLPGTMAKLEPPEGCNVTDGLEVKVAFNDVWKESLTELSGGQRSLLALSLILSLLLFKPAPMYILDEVDAALDLSHTQNIGMMLRTHFSSSQFIVVSLKEGMFNNANVIFRTKFVDGISAVTRTVAGARNKGGVLGALAQSNALTNAARETEDEPQKKKGKSTGASTKKSRAAVEI